MSQFDMFSPFLPPDVDNMAYSRRDGPDTGWLRAGAEFHGNIEQILGTRFGGEGAICDASWTPCSRAISAQQSQTARTFLAPSDVCKQPPHPHPHPHRCRGSGSRAHFVQKVGNFQHRQYQDIFRSSSDRLFLIGCRFTYSRNRSIGI